MRWTLDRHNGSKKTDRIIIRTDRRKERRISRFIDGTIKIMTEGQKERQDIQKNSIKHCLLNFLFGEVTKSYYERNHSIH